MSEERLFTYLERMETAASRAIGYVAAMEKADLSGDPRTQDAVIANIAAIGECVTQIMDAYPEFVVDHPEIPWRDIRTMRDLVAHQYFAIDLDTIWLTAKIRMPELLRELGSLRNWHAQGE
jgi:uncharacterized protein with HEPN domain